jgi:hypothetical protein
MPYSDKTGYLGLCCLVAAVIFEENIFRADIQGNFNLTNMWD